MSVSRIASSVLLLIFVSYSVQAEQLYSDVIIFGDSLSDTGNIAGAITPNLPPPYFDNRISNGPLAVDLVAGLLGHDASAAAVGGNNFAVVGGNLLGDDLADLSSQISRYLDREQNAVDPNALYLLFMGGNDMRDLRDIASVEVAAERIQLIVAALERELERLSALGAEHFLVVNAADIGRIPQTLVLNEVTPGIAARTSDYVEQYNTRLLAAMENFVARSETTLRLFDVFSELNKILDSPGLYGFTVATAGCFNPMGDIDPFGFEFDRRCDSGLFPIIQPNFEGFVFFDSIHPTAAVHQLIGDALIERLERPALGPEGASLKPKWPLPISEILLLILGE